MSSNLKAEGKKRKKDDTDDLSSPDEKDMDPKAKRRAQIAKAARKHRRRQKEELNSLREMVATLEGEVHEKSKETSTNDSSSTNQDLLEKRDKWKKEASEHAAIRERFDRENEFLRTTLMEQLKFTQKLQRLASASTSSGIGSASSSLGMSSMMIGGGSNNTPPLTRGIFTPSEVSSFSKMMSDSAPSLMKTTTSSKEQPTESHLVSRSDSMDLLAELSQDVEPKVYTSIPNSELQFIGGLALKEAISALQLGKQAFSMTSNTPVVPPLVYMGVEVQYRITDDRVLEMYFHQSKVDLPYELLANRLWKVVTDGAYNLSSFDCIESLDVVTKDSVVDQETVYTRTVSQMKVKSFDLKLEDLGVWRRHVGEGSTVFAFKSIHTDAAFTPVAGLTRPETSCNVLLSKSADGTTCDIMRCAKILVEPQMLCGGNATIVDVMQQLVFRCIPRWFNSVTDRKQELQQVPSVHCSNNNNNMGTIDMMLSA